ncbi:MAG TPA: MFS transporter [Candidatus Thermoplasmatota archaeon]|nr:MFS transporter [Candidatus Thermoplasmatota archaeon]
MRDKALLRLYVATFLYSFAQALAVPLLPEHLQLSFGATLRFIGATMGLYGLMQIALRLPMGDMADRRGRKPSLLLAFAASVLSGLCFVFGPTRWWAVPGVILFGFGGGVFWVAANSYLFDRTEALREAGDAAAGAHDVARTTSDYTIAMSVAFLLGPPVGHLVADHVGFGAAFLVTVLTSLAGLLVTLTLPETPPAPRARPVGSSYRRAWRLLAHPALVLSAVGTFTYSLLFATQQSFFQLHALAVGMSVTVVGLLLGGRQASALVVRAGLPALLRRAGAPRVMVLGILALATATALVPFARSLPALVALVALAGVATGALIPANLMLVHEGAPRAERGLANGIYGTMLGLGSAVAPTAFGAAGARFGLDWAFWSAGAVGLVLLAWFALLRRRHVRAAAASA